MKKIIIAIFAAFLFMQNQAMNEIKKNISEKGSFYIETPSDQFFENDRWKKFQVFYNENELREDFFVLQAEEIKEKNGYSSLKIIAPKTYNGNKNVSKFFLNIKCDGPARTISPVEYRNIVHKNYTPRLMVLLTTDGFILSSKEGVKALVEDYLTWKSEKNE